MSGTPGRISRNLFSCASFSSSEPGSVIAMKFSPARSPLTCRMRSKKYRQKTSGSVRSEEHTSELQSPCNLVCRLLLEKKKNKTMRCKPLNNHAHGRIQG